MEQDLAPILENMPPLAQVALAATALVGLFVWLAGRKLARPFCALLGIVGGGLLAVMLMPAQGEMIAIAAIVGGIAGLVAAWGFFRLWMAAGLALMLAAALPAAALVWQGAPVPGVGVDDDEEAAEVEPERAPAERRRELAPGDRRREPGPRAGARDRPVEAEPVESAGDDAEGADPSAGEALMAVARAQAEVARAWWESLGEGLQRLAMTLAGLGAVIGVVLGLARPMLAATIQSAAVGGGMLFFAASLLVRQYAPDYAPWLPASPRMIVVALGLITTMGVLAQWTIVPRKADR